MAQPTAAAVPLNAGSGGVDLAMTTHGGLEYQWAFACWWEEVGSSPEVPSLASPMPIQPGTGITWAVTGTFWQATQPVSNSVLSVVGGGTEATAQRVTVATDSTGVLSVDDNGGSLTIDNDDTVSTNNSTTATLGVSGSFTGTGDDVLGYTTVTITLNSDVNSATDGMTFQFSIDNTNWDDTNTFTYTAADGARRFQFPVTARYFRINYTNGVTGQASFRVQTILHRQETLTTVHRLVDDIDPDRSATLVKAIVAAQSAGTGDYMAVQATAAGNFKVSVEEVNGAVMPIRGTVAHDSPDTADAPVKIGGVATTSEPGAVANNDLVNAYFDATGHQHVKVDGAALTALQLIADPVFADDAPFTLTSSKVSVAGAIRDDSLGALAAAEGDAVPLRVGSTGALHVTGGGGTEYVVDAVAPATPTGTASLMERADALGGLAPIAGDWSHMFCDANGALWVIPSGTTTVGQATHDSLQCNATIQISDADASNGNPVPVSDAGGALTVDQATHDSLNCNANLQVGNTDVGPTVPIHIASNTAKDGSGTAYAPLVDSDGHLQVDGLSVIPGTGATNLGKAIASVVGATDTGIALLAEHDSDVAHLTTAEGEYDVLRMADFGGLQVAPEQHHVIDSMTATTGWTALGNDTTNLATTLNHILGAVALTFDKVDGAANSVRAGIQKTLSSRDLGGISPHDLIQTAIYLSDIANVDYVFVDLGTDASNYNEWRISGLDLTAGDWEALVLLIGDASFAGSAGNGWNPSAVTFCSIGVAFNAETDTLAGIRFDEISFHTNQHTSTSINSEVTSSVSSANVNIQKVGNKVVNTQAGNVSTGTQRVTIASDDVNQAAIKTATELLDNTVVVLGTATYTETTTSGNVVGAVRNDDKATLGDTDNEIVPLQVDNEGALYVNQAAAENKSASGVAAGGAPGTDDMIAAVAGKKLLITALKLTATSTTTNNIFIDNVDNDLFHNTGNPLPMSMDADGDTIPGIVLPYNPAGWFKTDTVNEAVTLNSSAAQDIDWSISWIETD